MFSFFMRINLKKKKRECNLRESVEVKLFSNISEFQEVFTDTRLIQLEGPESWLHHKNV